MPGRARTGQHRVHSGLTAASALSFDADLHGRAFPRNSTPCGAPARRRHLPFAWPFFSSHAQRSNTQQSSHFGFRATQVYLPWRINQ